MVNIDSWVGKAVVVWFEFTERTIVGVLKHKSASLLEIECIDTEGRSTTWVVERSALSAIGLPAQE